MADNKFSRSQNLMASCVGELQRRIGDEITKSTLTKQLREL